LESGNGGLTVRKRDCGRKSFIQNMGLGGI